MAKRGSLLRESPLERSRRIARTLRNAEQNDPPERQHRAKRLRRDLNDQLRAVEARATASSSRSTEPARISERPGLGFEPPAAEDADFVDFHESDTDDSVQDEREEHVLDEVGEDGHVSEHDDESSVGDYTVMQITDNVSGRETDALIRRDDQATPRSRSKQLTNTDLEIFDNYVHDWLAENEREHRRQAKSERQAARSERRQQARELARRVQEDEEIERRSQQQHDPLPTPHVRRNNAGSPGLSPGTMPFIGHAAPVVLPSEKMPRLEELSVSAVKKFFDAWGERTRNPDTRNGRIVPHVQSQIESLSLVDSSLDNWMELGDHDLKLTILAALKKTVAGPSTTSAIAGTELKFQLADCRLRWDGRSLSAILDLQKSYEDIFMTGGKAEWDGYDQPKRKEVMKYVLNNGLKPQVVGDGNHPQKKMVTDMLTVIEGNRIVKVLRDAYSPKPRRPVDIPDNMMDFMIRFGYMFIGLLNQISSMVKVVIPDFVNADNNNRAAGRQQPRQQRLLDNKPRTSTPSNH